jgi:hypothetical protein
MDKENVFEHFVMLRALVVFNGIKRFYERFENLGDDLLEKRKPLDLD